MASPHVAGVVSLMLSTTPGLTPSQISQMLQETAIPFPSGSSCSTDNCGAGIVNAAAAVIAAGGSTPPPTTEPPSTTEPPPTTQPADAPGAFDKVGPANGSGNAKKSTTLSREASSDATSYWVCLEVDSTPEGVCDSFTYGPHTNTSVRFSGFASGSTCW